MDVRNGKRLRVPALTLVGVVSLAVASLAGISFTRVSHAASPQTGDGVPGWNDLYRKYMAVGTVGDCASCHAEARTAAETYRWLAGQQYMIGSPPYLIDPRTSCFSWLGGDMPPDGPSSYAGARRDFQAWANAGVQ